MAGHEQLLALEQFDDLEMDSLHEECGVFAIASSTPVADRLIAGTKRLEFRGYDGAGAKVFNGKKFVGYAGPGMASQVLDETLVLNMHTKAPGAKTGVGHTRYTTLGEGYLPYDEGDFAGVHNGNVENAIAVATEHGFSVEECTTDSKAMMLVFNQAYKQHGNIVRALQEKAPLFEGAFSMAFNVGNKVIGMRDPNGIRPLSIGRIPDGSYVIASETVAMDAVEAEWIRDVEHGEIVVIDQEHLEDGIQSYRLDVSTPEKPLLCGMELIYFMDPESYVGEGENRIQIKELRRRLGVQLAEEHPVENPDDHVVVGVPASGVPSAEAYAEKLGIQYGEGILEKVIDLRGFQAGSQEERQKISKRKIAINEEALLEALWDPEREEFRDLDLDDDSVVRGDALRKLAERLRKVEQIRKAGGITINAVIPYPMITRGCHLGTASKTKELLTYNRSRAEMKEYTGVDSLRYISVEGFRKIVAPVVGNVCLGCTGVEYPVAPLEDSEELDLLAMASSRS